MTWRAPRPAAAPTVGQVQRKMRALAKELDDEADAITVELATASAGPRPRSAASYGYMTNRAELLRSVADRIRAAAKG